MTIAYWCVLVGAFLPLLYTAIAKFAGPGFNNSRVRDFQERLEGFRKRAHWAHLNSFEAFPPFAAAVVIAHQAGAAGALVDYLALSWIGFRLLYGAFYLADQATLRSLAWLGAVVCWVWMFVAAAQVG